MSLVLFLPCEVDYSITLCLDNNFEEKRRKRKRREKERDKRKKKIICLGGNRKEMKGDKDLSFKSFQL